MYELEPEAKRLRNAINLLRRNNAGDIEDAVGIIEDAASDLRGHDCDDFATEQEYTRCEVLKEQLAGDLPNVRECLELGLPALVEKYGHNSQEVRDAQQVIEEQQ